MKAKMHLADTVSEVLGYKLFVLSKFYSVGDCGLCLLALSMSLGGVMDCQYFQFSVLFSCCDSCLLAGSFGRYSDTAVTWFRVQWSNQNYCFTYGLQRNPPTR